MQLASPFRSCRFGARYEIGTNYFLILEPAPLQHSRPHLESVPILYPVPTVLRQNRTEILEYFRNRLTNAFAEGMNSLIQAAKRKARGFRTFEGYRTMIFLAVGRLHLAYPQPFGV
jgi:hypothetical protein